MNIQQENFIRMLRSVMTDSPCAPLQQPDFSEIFQIAQAHKMGAFAFYALAHLPPEQKPSEQIVAAWRRTAMQETALDANYTYAYHKLLELFEQNEIFALPLKGLALKRVYPKPELRSVGDLDFLCHAEQREKIRDCLCAVGYRAAKYDCGDEDTYYLSNGICVEIHIGVRADACSPETEAYLTNLEKFALPCEGFRFVQRLPAEEHYIYIMLHLLKHFIGKGTGLRSILDIWTYRRQIPMDEMRLAAAWKQFGLETFVSAVEGLAEAWMSGTATTGVQATLGEYIAGSGVYGNAQNRVNSMLTDAGAAVGGNKLKYICKRVFWPYRRMLYNYPVLKKAPVLLPAFWVHRLWSALRHKPKKVSNEFRMINEYNAEDTNAMLRLRRELGLQTTRKI